MKAVYEGTTAGYIIEDDPDECPEVVCELCGDRCTDDFILHAITSSISICLCPECSRQSGREIDDMYLFTKPNHKS